MGEQHALFAPSSAPVWGHCSGSVWAAQAVPNIETQDSREGTATHWVVSECLTVWKAGGTALAPDWLGKTAPNGVVIDQEMVDSAEVMVSDVLDVCNQHGALRRLRVEHRVYMPSIHPTDNWGTLDVVLDLRHIDKVYLWDFKHGHGQVGAFENLQAIDYLEGLRQEWGACGVADQNIDVHIRIVQPRCYRKVGPVDEWVVKWVDTRGHVNLLAMQVAQAQTNPQMVSGKHCRYCPALIRCGSARQGGYHVIDRVTSPYAIETMDDADLATERQILTGGVELVKARLGALEDELEHRINNGATGTGLTLETGLGNLNWTVPPAQAAAFGQQFGVEVYKEAVITPTQAIAKAPAEVRAFFKQALGGVAKRAPTGLKLVPAEYSRVSRAFKRSK